MDDFKQKRFDTGEVEINYLEGPKNGPPIILLAGQALSLESYQYVLQPLSEFLHVFAVDIRGHGESGWTPGAYNFPNMGRDIEKLIENVIKEPTYLSGNSSGGLVALRVASNSPDKVLGLILEDVPIFSAEWPRLKDTWAYTLFEWNAKTIGSPHGRDLAGFFKKVEVPMEGKEKVIAFPAWIGSILSVFIKIRQKTHPCEPVEIPLVPPMVKFMAKSLSIYDPDLTKAFVDGTACADFDHANALSKVTCPILLLHANWFENEKKGLVGSMNNEDVERAMKIAPHIEYKKITSGHMIHFEKPNEYLELIKDFTCNVDNTNSI